MDCCNTMIIVERGKNMFEHVDTQKKTDDFERRITKIYNKYAEKDIAEEYMELWNGFVELIQYIQNQNTIRKYSKADSNQRKCEKTCFAKTKFRRACLGNLK